MPLRRAELVQPGTSRLPGRLEAKHALGRQQSLDPVGVPGALGNQRLALARQAPGVLGLARRRAHHGADLALTAAPGHQRAQQAFRVNPIGLRPAAAPVHRDRGRINHLALHPMRLQQAMHPETVATGLLDADNPNNAAAARLGLSPEAVQQGKQGRTIAGRDPVLAHLARVRRADRDKPMRKAQFQGNKQTECHPVRGWRAGSESVRCLASGVS